MHLKSSINALSTILLASVAGVTAKNYVDVNGATYPADGCDVLWAYCPTTDTTFPWLADITSAYDGTPEAPWALFMPMCANGFEAGGITWTMKTLPPEGYTALECPQKLQIVRYGRLTEGFSWIPSPLSVMSEYAHNLSSFEVSVVRGSMAQTIATASLEYSSAWGNDDANNYMWVPNVYSQTIDQVLSGFAVPYYLNG